MRNTDSGSWKTVTASILGFALGSSQLVLCYEIGSDTVFHMVDVDCVDQGTYEFISWQQGIRKQSISGELTESYDLSSENLQVLSARWNNDGDGGWRDGCGDDVSPEYFVRRG